MLAIRLSDEIESRLDSLAKANRQNKDVLCAGSNTGASGRLEDYYLSAETAARVRRGDEAVHSSEDVRKSLGLDD